MTVIITSDLHLTDAPRDADRWNLFPWLRKQVKKSGAKQVLILGDITDAKDRHSSMLVNRIVSEVSQLALISEVIILKGNHDFIDDKAPFFGFMNLLDGFVRFVVKPDEMDLDGGTSLFLPCTRDWDKDYGKLDFKSYKYIFTHQTFEGAIAENGIDLRGVPPSVFDNIKGKVYSGDIHVPQKIGKNIEYVGSPYRIHFGDTYKPRVLCLKHGKTEDLYFPAQGRELMVGRTLSDVEKATFVLGTQVKIRMRLKRSEYPGWPELRKNIDILAERRGWDVVGIELAPLKTTDKEVKIDEASEAKAPDEIVNEYAERKKLGKDLRKAGLEFMKDAQAQ